jgi:hypothetical protein
MQDRHGKMVKLIWTMKEVGEGLSEKLLRNGESFGSLVPAKVMLGTSCSWG